MASLVGRTGTIGAAGAKVEAFCATGSSSTGSFFFGNAVANKFVTLRRRNAVRGVFMAEARFFSRSLRTQILGMLCSCTLLGLSLNIV